ncbi:hypothetical protein ES702_01126 [subsurface metagenome]
MDWLEWDNYRATDMLNAGVLPLNCTSTNRLARVQRLAHRSLVRVYRVEMQCWSGGLKCDVSK